MMKEYKKYIHLSEDEYNSFKIGLEQHEGRGNHYFNFFVNNQFKTTQMFNYLVIYIDLN